MALTSLQTKLIGAAGTGIGGAVGAAIATRKSETDRDWETYDLLQ